RPHNAGARRVIRRLFVAAVASALATFIGALSVHASGVVLAVAAVAGVTVFVAWLCALHGTDDESGLALANPAWALGLTITGRVAPVNLIPLIAAQVVGAVIAGVAALAMQSRLPDAIVWAQPSLLMVAVIGVILGIIGIWILFAIDQQLT